MYLARPPSATRVVVIRKDPAVTTALIVGHPDLAEPNERTTSEWAPQLEAGRSDEDR
jgi:hypothetical protein